MAEISEVVTTVLLFYAAR